jgi:hypothetical protein
MGRVIKVASSSTTGGLEDWFDLLGCSEVWRGRDAPVPTRSSGSGRRLRHCASSVARCCAWCRSRPAPGVHRPARDGVDADACVAQLARRRSRQAVSGGFRRDVVGVPVRIARDTARLRGMSPSRSASESDSWAIGVSCGMLAAEYQTLSPRMQAAVINFFDANETWLERVVEQGQRAGTLQARDSASDIARASSVASRERCWSPARTATSPVSRLQFGPFWRGWSPGGSSTLRRPMAWLAPSNGPPATHHRFNPVSAAQGRRDQGPSGGAGQVRQGQPAARRLQLTG